MKTIILSFLCICISFSLFAQTDTTNNTNNATSTISNATDTASMDSRNSMDSAHQMMNNMDSNANQKMKRGRKHAQDYSNKANNMMNNTMNNMNNMISDTANSHAFAALPVLETYIPDNIVAQMKQKYPGDQVYDITAVKATRDSVMWNRNSATPANMQDSTNTNANQNTTTTNSANNMANNSGMEMPQKYNYVVRIIKSGALENETVDSDGNAVTGGATNQMNQ